MDLARDNYAPRHHRPPRRAGRRRQPRHARARFGPRTSPPVPFGDMTPAYAECSQPQPASAHSKPATVAELSQIPGARQALSDYIEILQEWSSRADQGGAAP